MLKELKFNYCPNCSSADIKEHEGKALLCKACGYLYYHNVAAAVAGIIEFQGKILLAVRSHNPKKGFLDFPGGFSDKNESQEQCLRREIKEELGLEICNLRYLGSSPNLYQYKEICYHTSDAFFVCTPVDMDSIQKSDEIADYVLVDPKKVEPEKLAFDSGRNILNLYNSLLIS